VAEFGFSPYLALVLQLPDLQAGSNKLRAVSALEGKEPELSSW
jgi:hypothetical protein